MRTILKKMMTVALITCLIICSGTGIGEAKAKKGKIKLNKKSITLSVGKSKVLTVKGTKKKAKWKSSNKKIVTVSSKGKIKAKKAGKATITANVAGKKLKCRVTVVKKTSAPTSQVGTPSSQPSGGETPSEKEYTVEFNTNGGTPVASQKVKEGNSIVIPADPVKNGYAFMGWFLDSEGREPFDMSLGIYTNTTLYAIWGDDYTLKYTEKITAEDKAELTVDSVDANIDSDDQVKFFLNSTVVTDSAELYDEYGDYVATLYDDGDSEYGCDDIEGDGVYSGEIYAGYEDENLDGKKYKAVLEVGNDTLESNDVTVHFYEDYLEDEINIIEYVDSELADVMYQAEGESLDYKKQTIGNELELLKNNRYISSYSYDNDSKCYEFVYNVGGQSIGKVVLELPEDNVKGAARESKQRGAYKEDSSRRDGMTHKSVSIAATKAPAFNVKLIHNFLNEGSSTNKYEDEWIKEYSNYVNNNLGGFSSIDEEAGATVSTYKDLQKYDFIIINSHGSYCDGDPEICLNEEASPEKDQSYAGDIKSGNVIKAITDHGTCYRLKPSFFKYHYQNNKLDDAIVYLGLCCGYGEGSTDTDLADAWIDAGADSVFAYLNSVNGSYDYNMLNSITKEMAGDKTTESALNTAKSKNGANDGSDPAAVMYLRGDKSKTITRELRNGTFDWFGGGMPSLNKWKKMGDARALLFLGGISPKSLGGMAVITTGIGSANSETTSSLSQRFKIPNNASTLSFSYDMISEEPMEFYGSLYDDTFVATLYDENNNSIATISKETINSSNWYGIKGIDFQGGDDTTYHTRWKNGSYDVSGLRGRVVTLEFKVFDLTDEIYDSAVVIDDVSVK